MQRTVTYSLLTSIFLGCTCGCIQEIDSDLPAPPKRLVLGCFGQAGRPVEAYVGRVTALADSARRHVADARVELYLDDQLAAVLPHVRNGRYAADTALKLQAGQVVRLRALAPGFPAAEATDTVPAPPDPATSAYFRWPTGISREDGTIYMTVYLTLPDLPGRSFYEVLNSPRNMYAGLDLTAQDPVLLAEADEAFKPTTLFFSDRLFADRTAELQLRGFNGNTYFPPPTPDNALILVRTTSRSYYRYRKTWTRHAYNQTTLPSDRLQVVWQGEPIPLYSNVRGGYGVLACFHERTVPLPWRR
ncbi:DUF4249 family protein [Hymenobacter gummosus]|uniref:DUF4249 family protein n=1 Tax=Hymenobacter gummosus TaxID=1776032 RepID=UPI001404697F